MKQAPEKVPLSKLRKIIAKRMTGSLQSAAQYTLHMEIDATNLVACKAEATEKAKKAGLKLSYTHMLVKIAAYVLERHPALNANFFDDMMYLHQSKHIGVAISLKEGLIVPIIKAVQEKSLTEIIEALRDLSEKAANGNLEINDVTGGTFTISNLGSYGIDSFTPILNLPEVAILGVNRITKKPRILDGEISNTDIIRFSLTVDHRVIDGVVAAGFLKTLDETLKDIDILRRLFELQR